MKIQDKKAKTLAIVATLVIGIILLSPTTAVPNINAQKSTLSMKVYDLSKLKPWQTMTPFGPMNVTNVHHYDGKMVDADKIMAKYGKIIHDGGIKRHPPTPGTGGWDEYGYYNPSYSLSSFTGYWTVPSAPSSTYTSGQVVFLFTALQDSNTPQTIIQPVLQYGDSEAINAANWELASWMCVGCTPTGGGSAYYSTPVQVYAGDTIYGYMNNDYSQVWTINATDTSRSNTYSGEQINTSTTFDNYDVTLESYELSQTCGDLPGNTDFTSLTLNGGSNTPSWDLYNGFTGGNSWCNMSPVKVSSSEIDLDTQS